MQANLPSCRQGRKCIILSLLISIYGYNYTEDNIGDINPIRYEEEYCDSETGIIASHSSYYYVWKNDEEIEYVVLRPYLGE